MASEEVRRDIWRQLAEAGRLARYYVSYRDSMQKKHLSIRGLLLFVSVMGTASLTGVLPDSWVVIRPLTAIAIAIVVVIAFTFNFGDKTKLLNVIALQCLKIETDCHRLWRDANTAGCDEDELRVENQRFSDQLLDITGKAIDQDIAEDAGLNEKAEQSAYCSSDTRSDVLPHPCSGRAGQLSAKARQNPGASASTTATATPTPTPKGQIGLAKVNP